MVIKYRVGEIEQDHPCGKCREIIPAGAKALIVLVPMLMLDQWGHEIPVRVPVRYHLEHQPTGLGIAS